MIVSICRGYSRENPIKYDDIRSLVSVNTEADSNDDKTNTSLKWLIHGYMIKKLEVQVSDFF